MKLKIKNFRSIDEKDIDLPETGLVRIAGDSGTGKSTVIDSLVWGLYGDTLVKGIKPLTGSKKPVVTIERNGQVITRQNSPSRLLIESNQYENEAAQAFIDNFLNMGAEVFQSCSYIKQKLKGSLLSYTAADQLRFVQKIAFGEQDPEAHKLKISNLIKELESEIKVATGQLGLLAEIAQNAKKTHETNLQRLTEQKKPSFTAEERQHINKQADQANSQLCETQNKLDELNDIIVINKDAINDSNSTYKNNIKNIEEQKAILKAKQEELYSLETPDSKYTLEKIAAAYSLIQAQSVWLVESIAAVKKLQKIQTITEKHGESKNIELTISNLSKQLHEQEQKITELKQQKYMAELSSKGLPCPHCTQPVIVSAGTLTKVHEHKGKAASEIQKEIDAAQMIQDKIDNERSALVHLHRELKGLLDETTQLSDPPLPAAQTQEQLKQFQEKIKKIEDAVKSYNIKGKILNSDISVATDKIAKLTQESDDIARVIQSRKSKLEAAIQEYEKVNKSLNNYKTMVSELKEKNKLIEIDEIYEKQLKQCQSDVNISLVGLGEAQGKYEKALKEQLVGEQKLKHALKLKELSDTAATQSIADTLNAINQHAKVYTELLFPNQGTVITLNNVRINKNDSVRAKMSVSVFHKGMEYDSLDQLSGGEQNRAMLAFQLALSDLFNSHILLLDEAFAGAHTELKNDCIESLRSVSSRKLVIIVEHGLDDGLFDEVIYV
jgi:DNA repair exonuclease SbcCD ATPase subunit